MVDADRTPTDKRALILRWIEEQEALCSAAIPAPWKADDVTSAGGYWIEATVTDEDGDHAVSVCGRGDWPHRATLSAACGRFIAASRSVLPLALAALRAEVEAHQYTHFKQGPPTCTVCGVWRVLRRGCPAIDRLFCSLGLQDSGR